MATKRKSNSKSKSKSKNQMVQVEKNTNKNLMVIIERDLILALIVLFSGFVVGSVSCAVSLYNGSKNDDVLDFDSTHLVEAPEEKEEPVDENDAAAIEDFLDSLVADQTNIIG